MQVINGIEHFYLVAQKNQSILLGVGGSNIFTILSKFLKHCAVHNDPKDCTIFQFFICVLFLKYFYRGIKINKLKKYHQKTFTDCRLCLLLDNVVQTDSGEAKKNFNILLMYILIY